MSSILDNLLAAGVAGPEVVSEQHDPNAINFVAGMSDPGEMIRCGYRPELRRHPGEADAAYQARITPLVAALPQEERDVIMGAALKRASLDVSNGRVSLVTEAGAWHWHGLGVAVEGVLTSADAIRLANMDRVVQKVPSTYLHNGERRFAPDTFTLKYGDTGTYLNTVGKLYAPIQNAEAFAFMDALLGKFKARYAAAGALDGGRKIFIQVHLPEQAFTVNGDDRTEPFAVLTNSHGDEACRCFTTATRTVCKNTVNTAFRQRSRCLSIRHTGNLKAKIAAAQATLGLAVEQLGEYREAAQAMTTVKVEARTYFGNVLDEVIQLTEAEQNLQAGTVESLLAISDAQRALAEKSLERKLKRRGELLEDMLARYDGDANGRRDMRGTAWAAFNAVTETANHYKPRSRGTTTERAERRFDSVLSGEADELVQAAFAAAAARLN